MHEPRTILLLLAAAAFATVGPAQSRTDGMGRHPVAPGSAAPAAAPGDFFVFGNGCPGSGAGLVTAFGLNENASTTQPGGNTNQFAYKAQNLATSAVVVVGFELWTTSISNNPVLLTTELYDESMPGGPPNLAPIRSGSMVVGTKPAFYRTTFAQPYVLAPQATVFPSFLGNANILHTRTGIGGTLGTHWFHAPTATAWSGPFTTQPLAWRILTPATTGARPLIGSTAPPAVGMPFQVTLAEARAGTLATLTLGASNASWGSLTLPLDLTVFGMPGCKAHASVDVTFPFATGGTGAASLPLVVPSNPALSGVDLWSQWYVIDPPANGLGMVNSDAAVVRIG